MQNVPPALLVRFLREHRSEWADYGVDAYSAACLKASPYAVPCARPSGFPSSQVILPLAHTIEHEEVLIFFESVIDKLVSIFSIYILMPPTAMMQFLEVVRIEGNAFPPDDVALACDMYLLQVKPFFFILFKQELLLFLSMFFTYYAI